ncbi:MAG: glycosidase, partial [Sphingomonas sp.]
MITYAVEQLDTVAISAASVIDGMDLMSPFVWKEGDLYRIMVRGVPHPLGPQDP